MKTEYRVTRSYFTFPRYSYCGISPYLKHSTHVIIKERFYVHAARFQMS